MANCGQACPYNTLDGCKVKEYNAICPLTNMATPVTEYRMTNADRIRAMSDEELAEWIARTQIGAIKCAMNLLRLPYDETDGIVEMGKTEAMEWLKQPVEEVQP